jgi:hypothetical protein
MRNLADVEFRQCVNKYSLNMILTIKYTNILIKSDLITVVEQLLRILLSSAEFLAMPSLCETRGILKVHALLAFPKGMEAKPQFLYHFG